MTDSITSTRSVEEWFKDFLPLGSDDDRLSTGVDDKRTFAFNAIFPITRTVNPDEETSYVLHNKIICTNVRFFDEQLNPLDVSTEMINELQRFLTENEWGDPDGLEEIWNWGDEDDEDEDE